MLGTPGPNAGRNVGTVSYYRVTCNEFLVIASLANKHTLGLLWITWYKQIASDKQTSSGRFENRHPVFAKLRTIKQTWMLWKCESRCCAVLLILFPCLLYLLFYSLVCCICCFTREIVPDIWEVLWGLSWRERGIVIEIKTRRLDYFWVHWLISCLFGNYMWDWLFFFLLRSQTSTDNRI